VARLVAKEIAVYLIAKGGYFFLLKRISMIRMTKFINAITNVIAVNVTIIKVIVSIIGHHLLSGWIDVQSPPFGAKPNHPYCKLCWSNYTVLLFFRQVNI